MACKCWVNNDWPTPPGDKPMKMRSTFSPRFARAMAACPGRSEGPTHIKDDPSRLDSSHRFRDVQPGESEFDVCAKGRGVPGWSQIQASCYEVPPSRLRTLEGPDVTPERLAIEGREAFRHLGVDDGLQRLMGYLGRSAISFATTYSLPPPRSVRCVLLPCISTGTSDLICILCSSASATGPMPRT